MLVTLRSQRVATVWLIVALINVLKPRRTKQFDLDEDRFRRLDNSSESYSGVSVVLLFILFYGNTTVFSIHFPRY